jgi:hypothetical protein
MGAVQLVTVPVLTDGAGAFSASITAPGCRLLQYRYVPDGTAPLDTGADLDVVGAKTGFVYINQDNLGTSAFQKLPRHATHDETGAASLYAAAGEPVEDLMHVAHEALTVSIANGGAAKAGTLYFWFA